mmetsp:Transcript_31649/g.61765  ORF Transcript_31649/g.61765 Transcript_31649/m.61765 type:complete len:130 (+) Transcript_31649:227-616(+)
MDPGSKPKICACCGKSGAPLKCPCKSALYCDVVCQKESWPTHRKVCTVDLLRKLERNRVNLGRDDPVLADDAYELGRLYMDQDRLGGGPQGGGGAAADCELRLLATRSEEEDEVVLRGGWGHGEDAVSA